MKNYSVLIALFIVVGSAVNSLQAGRNTAFNTVATYTKAGILPVEDAIALNTWEEFVGYLSDTYYDTSQLTSRPDFSSVTALAIAYNKNGEDYIFTQSVRAVTEVSDSVIVEIKVDSQIVLLGIIPHDAFDVIIISFPKTEKPVSIRKNRPTEVISTRPVIDCKSKRYSMKKGLMQSHTVNLRGQNVYLGEWCGLKVVQTEKGPHKMLTINEFR